MLKILHIANMHKLAVFIFAVIILFLFLRIILLQKPNTEVKYTVKQEDLVDTVQVSGTYTAASQTEVTSPANGVITDVYVHNGDEVKKGDPIFHVQSIATPDQQKAAYANYLAASSQVQADTANLYSLQSTMFSTWKKFTDLATNSTYQNADGSPNVTNRTAPEFTTAQDNWLAAEATYKNQQSIIAKDQAAFSAAQQVYEETQSITVTAPADGTIVNLLKNSGDQVAADTSEVVIAGTATGQAVVHSSKPLSVLVIANLSNPYITADISEDYAARITAGQKVQIVFDALKDQSFSGTVKQVATVGTTTQGIVSYTARIVADNVPMSIKPNMTALITIDTLRKDNIIDVPNIAVIKKEGLNFVQEANTHKLIPVEIGTKGTVKTEITKGLIPGIVIIANPDTN